MVTFVDGAIAGADQAALDAYVDRLAELPGVTGPPR